MALRGIKVIEMAGLAPTPFAGMILADFGASVIRVDKPNQPPLDTLCRNKRSLAVNLKQQSGIDIVKKLCSNSDVLIEGYRPGIMERLGLGPDELLRLNSKLVYARLTGFGQNGSLAHRAGHDINYLATSGILSMLGRSDETPSPPINLVGDFAGGSCMCVIGILMALLERQTSNRGQVIDAAMVDGSAYLGSFLLTSRKIGLWTNGRGKNMLDGGAHFYCTYRTADDKFMSVGAIEPQFYAALLEGLGVSGEDLPGQLESSEWGKMKEKFESIFLSKTRDEWTKIFSGLDACVEPVLEMDEACEHPHNRERHVFQKENSGLEIMPAPKLDKTPAQPGSYKQPVIGEHTLEVLRECNYTQEQLTALQQSGAIYQADLTSKL